MIQVADRFVNNFAVAYRTKVREMVTMCKFYGLTLLLGALFSGAVIATETSQHSKIELLLAQVYGSSCQTPTKVCPLDYEAPVGSPCQCDDGEYGAITEY